MTSFATNKDRELVLSDSFEGDEMEKAEATGLLEDSGATNVWWRPRLAMGTLALTLLAMVAVKYKGSDVYKGTIGFAIEDAEDAASKCGDDNHYLAAAFTKQMYGSLGNLKGLTPGTSFLITDDMVQAKNVQHRSDSEVSEIKAACQSAYDAMTPVYTTIAGKMSSDKKYKKATRKCSNSLKPTEWKSNMEKAYQSLGCDEECTKVTQDPESYPDECLAWCQIQPKISDCYGKLE